MQRQLAVCEKRESYLPLKTIYEATNFSRQKATSTTNSSTSCWGSKDVRVSNGGPFEEFIQLLSSVFLKKRKKCQNRSKPYLLWSPSRRTLLQGCY